MNSDVIHSVYLTRNGIIAGFWAKKLKKIHIAQAIGSDVNSELESFLKRYNYKKWIENIDGILTNSQDLERKVRKCFSEPLQTKTIYRGIEIPYLQNASIKEDGEGTTFLYMGGLERNIGLVFGENTKGGFTLMEAWEKVEEDLNSLNAQLYFGGPDSDRNVFHKWKSRLKYPANVHLLGKISPQEVIKYIRKAEIVIVPSMEEGLPNFLMESYANATAAIGSDAGGIPEVMIDGHTGYIFRKGDVNQLSKYLKIAAENKEINVEMGLKAFERVRRYFNAEQYSRKVLNFYNEVCAE